MLLTAFRLTQDTDDFLKDDVICANCEDTAPLFARVLIPVDEDNEDETCVVCCNHLDGTSYSGVDEQAAERRQLYGGAF